jgi:hypothetical protein
MLGFGGRFLTKARRYSVTFRLLRDGRAAYRRAEDHTEDTLLVSSLSYVGAGWLSDGDALLANTAAATLRERRRVGREEVAAETGRAVA